MATYLMLNIIVIAMVALVLARLKWWRWDRAMTYTLLVLVAATALFDSLIIAAGIVAYDPSKLLGIVVGQAPIEDFFYTVAAVMIVPMVWHGLGRRKRHGNDTTTD